jgi:hypothetical protein
VIAAMLAPRRGGNRPLDGMTFDGMTFDDMTAAHGSSASSTA